MRWRYTLIATGCFMLGCHSFMQFGEKESDHVSPAAIKDGVRASDVKDEAHTQPATVQTAFLKLGSAPERVVTVVERLVGPQELDLTKDRAKDSEEALQSLLIRLHYAEHLVKQSRDADARKEFDRFICDAQDLSPLPLRQLIHGHSRLMELAMNDEDEYGEHFHRGAGLFYLACQSTELGETNGKLNVEALLCQAAGELTLAKMQKPDQPRPSWYLHEVWLRLDQRRPAQRSLRDAQSTSPFGSLTPAERRGLYSAVAARENYPLPKR
ncbi:MAG: hypothetical protein ACJ8FY_24860 [Gemmataceae bacterium]